MAQGEKVFRRLAPAMGVVDLDGIDGDAGNLPVEHHHGNVEPLEKSCISLGDADIDEEDPADAVGGQHLDDLFLPVPPPVGKRAAPEKQRFASCWFLLPCFVKLNRPSQEKGCV